MTEAQPPDSHDPSETPATGAEPLASEVAPRASLNKRKTIISGLITLVVLAIVFAGVLPKIGNYSAAWESIKTLSVRNLAMLAATVILMLVVYVWPYLPAIPGLRYWPAFVVRQTSFTISNGVPGGGAVGLAVQYSMLGSYGVSGPAATAGIAITSVWSLFMTLGLPILGVLVLLATGALQSQFINPALVGLAGIVGAVVLFAIVLRSEAGAQKVGGIAQRMVDPLFRLLKRRPPDLVSSVTHFRSGTVAVVSARWKAITVSNLAVVFMQFLVLWVAIVALRGGTGSSLSFSEAFAAFAISRLGTMIPITPGGLGTVDAVLVSLLVGFGLDQGVALAADLVWRAASFVPQILLGIGTFVWWRGRQAKINLASA